MKKVLKHLKNNAAIYLVLIACIVVICFAVFYKPKAELKEVDTSLFEIVDVDRTIKLFNDNTAKYLIISTAFDQTTASYVDHVRYAMITNGFTPYFLYQEKINFKKDKEKIEQLEELLNLECTNGNQSKPIMEWVKEGVVPITVIIKNKKPIYAYIGTINTTSIDSLSQAYGLGDNNQGKQVEVA